MAFDKDPVVDENSKRSEESVNFVKSLLTRKNGFISREELPDYGVDLDIELVIGEEAASSKKFAVQIKSTSAIQVIQRDGSDFISLNFKTSRLGYLARRLPGYGIIVLYDERTASAYYDHVEDIIRRLDDSEGKADWRSQDSVNIWLPLNAFDSESIKKLHHRMIQRHQNHEQMTMRHGKEFNIPYLADPLGSAEVRSGSSTPEDAAEMLSKHGAMLFNENQFGLLLRLINLVPRQVIVNSPELLFLAAVTFSQMGDVIEAGYYLSKVRKRADELSEEHRALIAFSEIHLEFLKGEVSYQTLADRFIAINAGHYSMENQLILEINTLFATFYDSIHHADPEFEGRIKSLFSKIENSGLALQKQHLLRVLLSGCQHSFALQLYMVYYTDYKVKQSLGIIIPETERAAHSFRCFTLIEEAKLVAHSAYVFAEERGLSLLKANAGAQLAMQFVAMQAAMLMVPDYRFSEKKPEAFHRLCVVNQNFAGSAMNSFLELQLFEKARQCLGTAIDIHKLSFHLLGMPLGVQSETEMLKILREIENKYDLSPYTFVVDEMLSRLNNSNDEKKNWAQATDTEIKVLAQRVLTEFGLPKDRLQHIVSEMEAVRTFKQHCNHPDLILHFDQNPNAPKETLYTKCSHFVIVNQRNGRCTIPGSDIQKLLLQVPDLLS